MQAPSASDPSFKAFLDKLQEQNNRGFVTQLVQLKAEREIAGEDNDKREEQLNDVISSLKEVRLAVTGNKLDIDLTPLINIGENQTKLLEELSKEASLTRKLTEGSVEYDKEAAQYRNTSGRDIESKVSGKTSKDGGFLDFETARDTVSGQGKRAKEANAFDLKPINYTPGKAVAAAVGGKGKKPADEEEDVDQPAFKGFLEEIKSGFKFFMTDGLSEEPGTGIFQTPSKEVEKKNKEDIVSRSRQENPEADNVTSTGEILADTAKSDLELSKQMLDTTKEQLVELKAIREALAPKIPKELTDLKSTPTSGTGDGEGGGGGGILGMLGMGGLGKGLMTAGKAVLPYALPAAAMIGTGAAVDYGLGKLGVGKDKEGNDLKIDTKQDDANWAKMSMGQKIQSGVGRGIEKVGSALFLDNMSREAQADRVKNETEYFKDKDFVDSSKEQDEANYKKMSFGKKILSSINRGGEKLSLFDSTKTTAARIRKETEDLKDKPAEVTKAAAVAAVPGAATKEALAPTPATVKDQAPGAAVEPDITFRRSKRESSTIGGRVITGFEGGYNLHGKKEDVQEADAAWDEFSNAKDDAAAEAAGAKFKTLATKIQSPEYQEKMKGISKAQQEKKKAGINPAKEEKVSGGPGAKNPVAAITPATAALQTGAVGQARQMVKNGEIGPSNIEDGVFEIMGNVAGVSPESADIIEKAVRAEFKKAINDSDSPGAKKPVLVVEKKSLDTAAPGKALAIAPKETVDGKKVKPSKDVDKAQQAAKEKYQASTSEEKAASEKLKAFEKENQFDYREKPTIMQAFDDEPGTGKFKDPKKQEEYDKLKGAKQQASESKRSAGAAYTAAEGVTKTQDFTGGVQAPRPGAKGGIRDEIDRKNDSMQSDGAKIQALQKRGYTDKDLGRDDTLTKNFIEDTEGKKYPLRNLGLYEAVVKKELEAPIKAKTKDGQVIPKETVDGKPAAAAKGTTFDSNAASDKEFEAANADQDATEKYASNLDKIAMAEAKKGGRATPDISDRRAAQIIARREAIKTAGPGVTEGTLKGVEVTPEGVLKGGKISNTGKDVAKTSTENADMGREAGKGGANNTVVSNNVSSNNTTKFVPMKANPRPEYTGSSLDRYTNRITVY
jgi:hypothetical protein